MTRFFGVSVAVLILTVIVVSPAVGAGEGRVAGTVVDSDGNPLVDVLITVTATDYDFETTRTTNKKGRFTLLLMDATKDYRIRLEKEGFVPLEEALDPPLGETLRITWILNTGQARRPAASQAPGAGPSQSAGTGQAGRKYSQGMEAYQQQDFETARQRFQEVVELQPDLPEAHTALAMVLIQQGSFAEALAESEKVLELRPDDVLALKVQYEAYKGLGNTEMEEMVLDRLIEVSPDQDLAPLVFNSAVAKVQAGDLAAGAERFEQVREMAPDLDQAYSALARVYFDLGQMDQSIAMANVYLERNPADGAVLGVLYLAYDRQGNTAEAEATFERLKGAEDTAQIIRVMEEMGVSAFNNGNTEQAKELFERILEMEPDHPRAHYHLALVCAGLGDTAKAKELLSRFVELAPDDPDAAVAREMISSL